MPSTPLPVTNPVETGVSTLRWVGKTWGAAGVFAAVLLAFSAVVFWWLTRFVDTQLQERKEDKTRIITMTENVTKTLSETAVSNDKLSQAIEKLSQANDKHTKAIDDLQRTMERRPLSAER